ncbi:type II CRISPR-associated endonuclease Cas1 [Actinobacillus porcinus]|uniref:type II CRISPR-associated endonuclease Cas1 n=1 Tax=Actinobacillus porcinus TaxID=51048 RepID=UPI002351FFA3|nr:type II CRISPR-associated endonuclease Cas1 [Actinobacillus porcinus]MCI5764355.1 type II CRISPR-associated endonuclease Cas1 [Actinobacillus porcinus]MDY5420508.1 type II CRISPR-associated endonuclease Cas1 [Actinobacillus porcinus]
MTWRSILISKGGKLSLHQNQMLIQQNGNEFTVPLEDIAIVVVESRETVITVPLLSAFGLHGVTLLTCDEQFLPCGQWLPFNQYHRHLKNLKLQLEASVPQKKQLWQVIVQQKIRNQAKVLEICQFKAASERLFKMAELVKSGDKDNLEAQSAVIYFQVLFGKGFKRTEDENLVNSALNYGYTVMRSAVARAVVLYGWLPQLGLFHHNELNAFNLADDFIESFRPLVDLLVVELSHQGKLGINLSPSLKQELIKVLNYQLLFKQEKVNALTAIDRTISSFQSALISKNPSLLKLPEILPLAEHQYE